MIMQGTRANGKPPCAERASLLQSKPERLDSANFKAFGSITDPITA